MADSREGPHDTFPVHRMLQYLASHACVLFTQSAPQSAQAAPPWWRVYRRAVQRVEHDPRSADKRKGPSGVAELAILPGIRCLRHGVAEQAYAGSAALAPVWGGMGGALGR